MKQTTTRRRARLALTALIVAPALAACSFSAGDLEPVGDDAEASQSAEETPEASEPAQEETATPAELTTIHAQHIAARVPADWETVGDADGWSFVHQKANESGGVAGRVGFMPGGSEMSAQESVDWFIDQVEGKGVTDENYAPVTTLRDEPERANTSYTYSSGGETYTAVVWGLTDGNDIPSLVQLSGTQDVMTEDFVKQFDQSLNLNGDWEGKTS